MYIISPSSISLFPPPPSLSLSLSRLCINIAFFTTAKQERIAQTRKASVALARCVGEPSVAGRLLAVTLSGGCRRLNNVKYYLPFSRVLRRAVQLAHYPVCSRCAARGGFFLACEDFWRMFDQSFPTCLFFFFFFLSGG